MPRWQGACCSALALFDRERANILAGQAWAASAAQGRPGGRGRGGGAALPGLRLPEHHRRGDTVSAAAPGGTPALARGCLAGRATPER